MSYQVTSSAPKATFDIDGTERAAAQYFNTNNITSNAALATHIDSLTDAQFIQLMRSLIKKEFTVG